LKKLLKRLDLKPLKTKLIGRPGAPTHSFVTFRCDEDREEAINKLNNYLWKNRELVVKKANPIADPLVEKRNERRREDNADAKRLKRLEDSEVSEEQLADTLNDKIASLWRMSYSQQLTEKYRLLKTCLLSLNKELTKIVTQSGEESSSLGIWLT
jgi:RNA recognition motif-containing protein